MRAIPLTLIALLACGAAALAQSADYPPTGEGPNLPGGFPGLAAGRAPQVEIAWNRLYGPEEIDGHFARLAERWPSLLTSTTLGTSVEGRPIRVWTLNDPSSGPADAKPAMWIDGNVHGNEVQASETVLYTAWYLLENRDHNPRIAELLGRAAFYLQPSINPDGRAAWFRGPATASSERTGQQPTDNDRDGRVDEDGPNDLDGDGHITRMRKYVPGEGSYRLDPDDPRLMLRVNRAAGETGDWILLGREGLDDDGDGRVDEDGVGGYDMNRAWPSGWQPPHVQSGAGPYPLHWPETRLVADFILSKPNIAAAQSFHNSGGMILVGPGYEQYGSYPSADRSVYDAIAEDGEAMLPHYDYLVIWEDLYSVYGGFVNWTYEGLGILSFTNELWTGTRNSPDGRIERSTEGRHRFDDLLLMSAGFRPWTKVEHPIYGTVEVGGFTKDVGRVPPSFLLEEELHRNALFCLRHAEALPEVEIEAPQLSDLGGGLLAVDVVVRNLREIPTRSAMAERERIGLPDVYELSGQGLEVVAAGERSDRFRPERIELVDGTPARIVREAGIGRRDSVRLRYLVRGSGTATLRVRCEKARDVELSFSLR